MTFGNQVQVGSPQQPAGWNAPYYYNANITWNLGNTGNTVNTDELSLNFRNNGNDGIAPVPEPATLLLLGSGLLGCVALASMMAAPVGVKLVGYLPKTFSRRAFGVFLLVMAIDLLF